MKIVKQLASALLCFSMLLPLAACGKKSPAATADFTLTDMEQWCKKSADNFMKGFKQRDLDTMKSEVPNSLKESFADSYKAYEEEVAKKPWLEDFFQDYLYGSQAINGTFLSENQKVTMDYAVVIADYSTGNRNWLLIYNVTLEFGINAENKFAYIVNPEVVFDLYDSTTSDYTTHVAATLLDVNDDFDLSNYYYDEELGVYVDKRTPTVTPSPVPTEEPVETTVPAETEDTEETSKTTKEED